MAASLGGYRLPFYYFAPVGLKETLSLLDSLFPG